MSQTRDEVIGAVIFVCIAFTALGIFVLALLFSYQRKYIKHIKAEESLKLENQKNLLNAQIEVREQTLKDAGQELHDNVGQLISLAKMQLASLKDEKTNHTKQLLQTAIVEIRNLSHRLNLDWAQDFDFIELIHLEVVKLQRSGLYQVDFQTPNISIQIQNNHKVILLRCLQEAIQNIVKHAFANAISLNVAIEEAQIKLTLTDNGKGFDTQLKTASAGLKNMTARMKSIGGSFQINSQKDKGTVCVFEVGLDSV